MQVRLSEWENEYLSMLPAGKAGDQRLRDYCHTRAAAQATLERTEIIIDELAAEIRQRLPRVQHVTIEIEGMATAPVIEPGASE